MRCPKCASVKIVSDRELDPPHTCTECWRAFEDKDVTNTTVLGPEDDPSIVPDAIGEILAWRAWYIMATPDGPRLQSFNRGEDGSDVHYWQPGEIMYAHCPHVRKGHVSPKWPGDDVLTYAPVALQVPVEGCSCGYYAAIDREHLMRMGYNAYRQDYGDPVCIGQVALSGKVIPGTQGWKAQQVWPVKLHVPYEYWRFVQPLRDAYAIPVELDRTMVKGQGR